MKIYNYTTFGETRKEDRNDIMTGGGEYDESHKHRIPR